MSEPAAATTPIPGPLDMTEDTVTAAKAAFVATIVDALQSTPLALVEHGYDMDESLVTTTTPLDRAAVHRIALTSWYQEIGVPPVPAYLIWQEANAWADGGWAHRRRGPAAAPTRTDAGLDEARALASYLSMTGWSEETSATPEALTGPLSASTMAAGQSDVTALALQEKAGGEVLRVTLTPRSRVRSGHRDQAEPLVHHFNRLPGGQVVDITLEELSTYEPASPVEPVDRDTLLADEAVARRYVTLRRNLFWEPFGPEQG